MTKCSYKRCRQAGDAMGVISNGRNYDLCQKHWERLASLKGSLLDLVKTFCKPTR